MAEGEPEEATAEATPEAAAEEGDEGGAGPAKKRKNPRWLPLESNPDILNGFMERVGVEPGASFADLIGLDEELLQFVPQPVLAVCLLFPSGPVRKPRLADLAAAAGGATSAPASTFYLIQHKEFGNACGTIAVVHALGNLARAGGGLQLAADSPLSKFLARVAGRSPSEVGYDLADAAELHEASEEAARSERAQTRTPGRHDKVDGHFVVFVAVEGRLVELDGCMGQPIDHGPTSPGGFLRDSASVIRKEFMARAPGNPNFSVMALSAAGAAPPEFGASGAAAGAGEEAQLRSLVEMGFPEASAIEALAAAGGNVEVALEMLCAGL